MGKEQELLEAARHGNIAVVEKILLAKSKRSGPLARLVYKSSFLYIFSLFPFHLNVSMRMHFTLIANINVCLENDMA